MLSAIIGGVGTVEESAALWAARGHVADRHHVEQLSHVRRRCATVGLIALQPLLTCRTWTALLSLGAADNSGVDGEIRRAHVRRGRHVAELRSVGGAACDALTGQAVTRRRVPPLARPARAVAIVAPLRGRRRRRQATAAAAAERVGRAGDRRVPAAGPE